MLAFLCGFLINWWYYSADAGWCGWCDSHNGTYSRCRANIYADSGLRCFLGFSCHIHYNPLISEIWIDIENLWNVLGFQIWAAAQCEGLCAFVVLFILHTVCICLPVSVCTEFYCPPGLYSIKIKMIWFVPMQIVKLEKRRQ